MANDDAVRKWIHTALKNYDDEGGDRKLLKAWRWLQGQRQVKELRNNLDLACAEHYMFARLVASANGVNAGIMAVLIPAYYVTKLIAHGNPTLESIVQSDTGPVTPPSGDQVEWGYAGVRDAVLDPRAMSVVP